jgi:hypothetical protein
MKSSLLASVSTISMALVAVPVQAADLTDTYLGPVGLPAVSAPNWKFGIAGGLIDLENQSTDGRVHAEGSVSIPLTFSTGLQIDGMIGDLGGDTTGSIGGHLFYRDPTYVLLGAWGGYHGIGSNDIVRFGPEAAFYLGNFTVEGTVGWEDSDSDGSDAYAHVNAAMYPNDDLKVYLGYRRTLGRDAAAAGFEWLTGHQLGFEAPMSLFAEGQLGEDDHSTVWVGLRFYLGGEDKSLIRRHREDDPNDPAPGLSQLAASGTGVQQCIPFILPDEALVDSCGNPVTKKTKED